MEIAVSDFNSSGDLTQKVLHTYDAFNRWIGQTIDDDGDGTVDTTRQFVQDGGQVTLAFKDGQLTNRYLWSTAVDELLADESIASGQIYGATRWALTDHLGSVRDLVNTESEIVYHAVYDAYGKVLTIDGEADSLFGFTGRAYDNTTGLQNNHNRWYDSGTGRWLSQDPIGFKAGDANLYRYVSNRSANFIDPAGLETQVIRGVKTSITRKGHHVFPVEIWEWSGLDPSLFPELDSARIGIGNPHNLSRHGSVTGYTGHVKVEFSKKIGEFFARHGVKDGKLTISQQRMFMSDFINHLKNCRSNDYIRGFNSAVKRGGTHEVVKWFDKSGHKLSKPVLEGLEVIRGVASAAKIVQIGEIFIKKGGKWVLAAFAAYLVYNNSVAQGRTPEQAAQLAAIEVVNPFFIGVEEFNYAGEKYEEIAARAKVLGKGEIDPSLYEGTYWYGMAKNRAWLRQLKEETGGCIE